MKPTTHITLRVLARLLAYPSGELRNALPELVTALRREKALRGERVGELVAFARQIAAADPYEIEARYVDTFDRGRATSLHLFEHVHGDSRERGPAMIDLARTYDQAGLPARIILKRHSSWSQRPTFAPSSTISTSCPS